MRVPHRVADGDDKTDSRPSPGKPPVPADMSDLVKANSFKVVLLAAGIGSRLRPLTDATPKCLVRIAGRPLLDLWLDRIADAGLREVLINTHHLAGRVRERIEAVNQVGRVRLTETHEPKLLGSAGTIRANRDWMDDADHCLVIYADNFSTVSLRRVMEFHLGHSDPLSVMLFRAPTPRRCGIAEIDAQGRITNFVEKPERPASDLANAGVYAVSAAGWREMGESDAFDIGRHVLPRFVGRMRGLRFDGYHRDIGTPEALDRVRLCAASVLNQERWT